MCARNRKVSKDKWAALRAAASWLAAKVRTGLLAVGLRGALLLLVAAACLWGIGLATRHVGSMRRFRIDGAHLRAEAPPWCADDLARIRLPEESYSIFDPRLTHDAAEAYRASPWVLDVRRIEKRLPDQLVVELDLRRPVAVVQTPDGTRTVDAQAVVLPLNLCLWEQDQPPLPRIAGVASEPPEPGSHWADARLDAALAVRAAVADDPALLDRLHTIDVRNVAGERSRHESEIVLFTHDSVRVAWGRAPNAKNSATEIPVPEKLATLRRRLDDSHARSTTIDLRFRVARTFARR